MAYNIRNIVAEPEYCIPNFVSKTVGKMIVPLIIISPIIRTKSITMDLSVVIVSNKPKAL